MSGPKVVDVRAVRAMQERAWRVFCHRLERELVELKTLCGSDGTEAERQALGTLEISLTKLKTEHQQRSLPLLLDLVLDQASALHDLASELRSNVEKTRIEKLAAEQAKTRSRHLAASSLMNVLEKGEQYELREQLSSNPTDENINRALTVLERQRNRDRAIDVQNTVNSLAGNQSTFNFDQWLNAHGRPIDPVVERLDKLAASVELISGMENASSWREKISLVAKIPDEARRKMQADSIAIQLADEKRRLQRVRDRSRQLDALEAELAAFDDSAEPLRKRVASARNQMSVDIDELKGEVQKWCEEEAKRHDQAECQRAILSVLRTLGYEVRESMVTAWAQNGKVVVQDSSRQDYGVELCTLDSGRLRTQLVRFSDRHEVSDKQEQRDTEVETQWCQSHAKVLHALTSQGMSTGILAARPAGAVPLKVIDSGSQKDLNLVEVRAPQIRRQQLP